MKSVKFHKLVRQHNKNTEGCTDKLRIAAIECNYKEIDRQLEEQFIYRLNDSDVIVKIIKEPTLSEENTDFTSNQVLLWARQIESQRTQTAVLNNVKVNQEFDTIW